MPEELPEIVPMPDELGPSVGTLRRRAEWADTFSPSDTSLVARHRSNQAKVDYAAAVQREREAQMQQELRTNKTAQDLFIRGEQLKIQKQTADAALAERDQRVRFAAEMHPLQLEGRRAQTAASLASERARLGTERLKAQLARQEADDTIGFQTDLESMLSSGVRAGTTAYQQAVAQARLKYPGVNKTFFDDVWKTTGSDVPPEEVAANLKKLQEVAPNATITADQTGRTSATVRPDKPQAEKAPPADSWGKWGSEFDAAKKAYGTDDKVPQAVWQQFEARKAKLEGRTTATPQADSRTALAQKALNDPNASEAHKAAARRILGQ